MSPHDPDIEGKLNRSVFQFLLLDIETAFTFVGLVRSADQDPEKQLRNQANARKAYDTVQELSARLHLSPEQQSKINGRLEKLKTELEALGEHF